MRRESWAPAVLLGTAGGGLPRGLHVPRCCREPSPGGGTAAQVRHVYMLCACAVLPFHSFPGLWTLPS